MLGLDFFDGIGDGIGSVPVERDRLGPLAVLIRAGVVADGQFVGVPGDPGMQVLGMQ
ncbi:hypothetical protein [Paraburkholderia kururiensis]|uniref:hypothetical protein n=1 Tax=Paraburkholderia kururiensis TaxID=984307 RepID=UPI0039A43CDD